MMHKKEAALLNSPFFGLRISRPYDSSVMLRINTNAINKVPSPLLNPPPLETVS
jgi:hypothetical protein